MVCKICNNETTFYRTISVEAKMEVDPDGNDTGTVYDVDKDNQDNWFEPIYCGKCHCQVAES